jgi:Protein of unknown function (DUF1353)
MLMNRRRFLYTSVCTAASLRHLSAFAQEQAPAQPEPKTLLEYRGSSAAVDNFMRGATASRKTHDAVSAFIAAVKEKPSGRDNTDADLVILPDKASDKKLNLKRKDSDAIAMKTDDDGKLQLWKTAPPKASSPKMVIHGLPTITRFAGDKAMWFTANEMGLNNIMVPIHFVTDLASIPAIFFQILPPDGPYTFPAIVHDWLYWHQAGTRDDADNTLRDGMDAFGVEQWKVDAIYTAVHKFGQIAWDSNAKLKAKGEGRLLAAIPDSPLITWDDWKTVPAHFIEPE